MINLHVMFTDDEPDIREIIDMSLALDPLFVLRGCASGGEALTTALEWRPDLILLDVMMPVMDGPATLSRLRQKRSTAQIPVVFMTARTQTREVEQFKALGAAGVIAKPFDPMALASEVRHFVPVEGAVVTGARGVSTPARGGCRRAWLLPVSTGAAVAGARTGAHPEHRACARGRQRSVRICRHRLRIDGAR